MVGGVEVDEHVVPRDRRGRARPAGAERRRARRYAARRLLHRGRSAGRRRRRRTERRGRRVDLAPRPGRPRRRHADRGHRVRNGCRPRISMRTSRRTVDGRGLVSGRRFPGHDPRPRHPERQRRVSLPDRGAAASVTYRALESGAAQLWHDGAVTLYDRSGRVTQQLDAHDVRVNDVVLAPDGTWAATVDTAGEIVLLGCRSGDRPVVPGPVPAPPRHRRASQAEASPDSSRLVTLSRDTAIVWDLRPGRRVRGVAARHPGALGGQSAGGRSSRGGWWSHRRVRWVPDSSSFFIEPGPDHGRRRGDVPRPADRRGGRAGRGGRDTWRGTRLGASVAVSPDRRWVAVTSVSPPP